MAPDQIVVDGKADKVVVTNASLAPSATKSTIGPVQALSSDEADCHNSHHATSRSAINGRPHDSHTEPKRKHDESADTGTDDHAIPLETAKRQKLSGVDPLEYLPMELWQHVFLLLSPAMLCRCLRVCKSFNRILTKEVVAPVSSMSNKKDGKVRSIDSETIWTNSRRSFYPSMPRPLAHFSELAMLTLIAGSKCQFCDRTPLPSFGTTPFNAGPGMDGCRVIWPFAIRSCGRCLESKALRVSQTSNVLKCQELRTARMSRFWPIPVSHIYGVERHMLIVHRTSTTCQSITANSHVAFLITCDWRKFTTDLVLRPSKMKRYKQSCLVRAQPTSGVKD
jgi:hypothetical protein